MYFQSSNTGISFYILDMEPKHYCHLFKRATLSVAPEQIHSIAKNRLLAVDAIFNRAKQVSPLTIEYDQWNGTPYRELSATEKKRIRIYNREKLMQYNYAWFKRMCLQSDNLRERMVLFWSNHFVVMSKMIQSAESFNNTLRTNALGNFKQLAISVAKEAAMIEYLDSNQNKKQAPNENFARELMELFTLGRDVLYTEKDVKEAARAFTGWRANRESEFIFAPRQHDAGEKEFLGKRGNFKGEDIIDLLVEHKECAHFICTKVYKEFVNENIDHTHVEELAEVFFKDYNIENLMRNLFMSDWFYEDVNIGSKVKSPMELLVSIYQLFPFEFQNPKQLIYLQRSLGQILLNPPNVAGWPGGLNWIDSNTLMLRLRLPSLIINQGKIGTQGSEEQMDRMQQQKRKNVLKLELGESKLALLKTMEGNKLNMMLFGKDPDIVIVRLFAHDNDKERLIKMMSVPEFQMC